MRRLVILSLLSLLPFFAGCGVVRGRVTCEGKPVPGVQVSDGRQIVLTDAQGRYTLKTDKADSVVFITTPSGYRAEMIDAVRPGFWQLLTEAPGKTEVHDFRLVAENQSNYSVLFITDCHFANDPSRKDLERFTETVLPVIRREVEHTTQKGPIYTMNLGDFAHDRYWYDFGFNEYKAEQFLVDCGYPTPVYSVTGNHDNDGAIAGLGERTDFVSAWNYRHTWGPACYSVNIGGDHWIFMDSVEYLNEGEPDARHKNINGKRNYNCRFLDKDLDWLREDLKYISPDTRVFFCCHVPVVNDASKTEALQEGEADKLDARHKNINGKRNYNCRFLDKDLDWLREDLKYISPDTRVFFCCHVPVVNDASKTEALQEGEADKLDAIFKDFPLVYLFAGHTHKHINTEMGQYTRFKQYIFSATSGSMWQHPEGYQAIGSDSCNQAFNVMNCSEPDPVPRYVAVNGSEKMMRVYDINAVGAFYRNDPQCRIFHKLYPERSWYADPKFKNMIYVNYWGYAPGQKVEIFEDGKPLAVTKSKLDEPLYVITYITPKLDESSVASKSNLKDRRTSHSFVATASTATAPVIVRVTDTDGNVLQEETLVRPKPFDKNTQ